jgi:hypothetical protein
MEVIVLGLPRTGTQCTYAYSRFILAFANCILLNSAIAEALKILGYDNTYHMREVGQNKHQSQWIAALEAKFEGKGQPWGREEFDDIFKGFDV